MVTKSSVFNTCIRNLSFNTFLIPKLFSIFRRNEKLSRLETMNKEQRSPLVFINSLLSHSLSLSLFLHICTPIHVHHRALRAKETKGMCMVCESRAVKLIREPLHCTLKLTPLRILIINYNVPLLAQI